MNPQAIYAVILAFFSLISNKEVQSNPALLSQLLSVSPIINELGRQVQSLPPETQIGIFPTSSQPFASIITPTDSSTQSIVINVTPPAQQPIATTTPSQPLLGASPVIKKNKAPTPPYYLSLNSYNYENCSDDSSCVYGIKPTSTRMEFDVQLNANYPSARDQLGGLTIANLIVGSTTYPMNIKGNSAKLLLDDSNFPTAMENQYSVYIETSLYFASGSDSFIVTPYP